MDDRLPVRGIQRVSNLRGDGQRLLHGKRSLQDAILERRSVHQLHDDRRRAAARLEAVHLGDVRVIQ